jgi:hypothetical protein
MYKIDSFRGEWTFLDNFYRAPFYYEGKEYATVEHFFQAFKAIDEDEHEKIRTVPNPGSAKKFGRTTKLRPEWEEIKNEIMFLGLILKFTQNHHLRKMLIGTEDALLEEGNNHGDQVWGTVKGIGENRLGLLLMEVRKNIKVPMV